MNLPFTLSEGVLCGFKRYFLHCVCDSETSSFFVFISFLSVFCLWISLKYFWWNSFWKGCILDITDKTNPGTLCVHSGILFS
jgi:hypothetical protein